MADTEMQGGAPDRTLDELLGADRGRALRAAIILELRRPGLMRRSPLEIADNVMGTRVAAEAWPPAADVRPPAEEPACGRCHANPVARPGADGTAGQFCAVCIDRCHESTDFAHDCDVCRSTSPPATHYPGDGHEGCDGRTMRDGWKGEVLAKLREGGWAEVDWWRAIQRGTEDTVRYSTNSATVVDEVLEAAGALGLLAPADAPTPVAPSAPPSNTEGVGAWLAGHRDLMVGVLAHTNRTPDRNADKLIEELGRVAPPTPLDRCPACTCDPAECDGLPGACSDGCETCINGCPLEGPCPPCDRVAGEQSRSYATRDALNLLDEMCAWQEELAQGIPAVAKLPAASFSDWLRKVEWWRGLIAGYRATLAPAATDDTPEADRG